MPRKIKILKNLPSAIAKLRLVARKYKTHRIFKAFESFIYLKELSASGKIQNRYGSVDAFTRFLAKHCHVSRNSMYTRVDWMKSFNLIEVDKAGNILLESWDSIAKRFGVKKGTFQEINLESGSPKLEHILRTLTIAEHKKRMEFSFAQKINSNNQLRLVIESLLGFKPKTIKEMADSILRFKITSFQFWSDSFDLWHSLPADFNASAKRLTQYFCFDDHRQIAYWKRKLTKLGLITVETRKFESSKCTRRANDLFNGGKVKQCLFWDQNSKKRVWQMPDSIHVCI